MLDNILNTVRQGVEKVQRRGEEMTQVARLKVEVYQLGRELEGHFARLGRSFHGGADDDLLQGIREDIRRTEDEIRARERLIAELGEDGAGLVAAPEDQPSAPGERGTPREAGLTSSASVAAMASDPPGLPAQPEQDDGSPTDPPDAAGHSQATTPDLNNRPAFTDQPAQAPGRAPTSGEPPRSS